MDLIKSRGDLNFGAYMYMMAMRHKQAQRISSKEKDHRRTMMIVYKGRLHIHCTLTTTGSGGSIPLFM